MNQGYCSICSQNVKAEMTVDWIKIALNIVLCFVTAGIWLIVFILFLSSGAFTGYRCNSCGGGLLPARLSVGKVTPPNGACKACDERVEVVKSTDQSGWFRTHYVCKHCKGEVDGIRDIP